MTGPKYGSGGQAPPKEYGAERDVKGWVKMTHPSLPDNDPISVIEAAIPAKMSKGWEIAEGYVLEVPAAEEASSWETTDDESDDELTTDGD